MTLSAAGFGGGSMTDDDFGTIADLSGAAMSCLGNGFIVTQPNTSARTLSIAPGSAVAHGVRVRNDAALPQNITAPGSGSGWYLLVLRRDWAAKTVSIVALAGATSGSTTTPPAPPPVFPASLQNSAGSAQADQPLAWVGASSVSTTLTLFDARVTTTGAGVVTVSSLWVLNAYTVLGSVFARGALVSVYAHSTPGGATIDPSLWRMWQNAVFYPDRDLRISTAAGLTELTALLGPALTAVGLGAGTGRTRALVTATDIVYLFVGSGNIAAKDAPSGAAWQAWSKALTAVTLSWQGLTVGSSTQTALWGISEGRFWLDLWFAAGSGYALSGEVSFTLPSPVVGQMSSGSGYYGPAGGSGSGTPFPLTPYSVGTPGATSTAVRVRAPQVVAAAPATPKLVLLSGVVTTAGTDVFQLNLGCPSAVCA